MAITSLGNLIAVFTNLSVIILIVAVQCNQLPLIEDTGRITNMRRRLMVAGITVAASVFSILVTSRIKHFLLRSFENDFREYMSGREDLQKSEISTTTDTDTRRNRLRLLNRRWRGVLGIDSFFHEKLINFRFHILWAVCVLNTTAIVVALTPSDTVRNATFEPRIPSSNYAESISAENHPCIGMTDKDIFDLGHHVDRAWAYRWELSNGSTFYSTSTGDGQGTPAFRHANSGEGAGKMTCASSAITGEVKGINKLNLTDYAYSIGGVSIHSSALAAPKTIFDFTLIHELQKKYHKSVVRTTQCVPVLVRNPVKCHSGGNWTVINPGGYNELAVVRVQADISSCGTEESLMRNIPGDSVMMATTCADAPAELNRTVEAIGREIIVIGAMNAIDGKGNFAEQLAALLNDPDPSAGRGGKAHYVATCEVNARDAFAYRQVALDFRARPDGRGFDSGNTYYLSGEAPCTPNSPTISNIMFAAAAGAHRDIVRENMGTSHEIDTIFHLTGAGKSRKPPFAFNDSRNALEDILGLVSAIGVSLIPANDGTVIAASTEASPKVTMDATRIGTDRAIGYFTLVPPILTLLALLILQWLSFRAGLSPIGTAHVGDGRGDPRLYAAENVYVLLAR